MLGLADWTAVFNCRRLAFEALFLGSAMVASLGRKVGCIFHATILSMLLRKETPGRGINVNVRCSQLGLLVKLFVTKDRGLRHLQKFIIKRF